MRAATIMPGASAAIGDERVVAAQPRVGAAHGLDEAGALEVAGDQVRDHLGVGLRREDGAVVERAPA